MKQIIFLALMFALFLQSFCQSTVVHEGSFKKGKMFMSSKPYSPDDWEKIYFKDAIKTAFPSNLKAHPDDYKGKLIHLLGIVDSVSFKTINDTLTATFWLENKFWDYIEDYSIQDEVMFISPKGDGKFALQISNVSPAESVRWTSFPAEKKLFLVYGNFEGLLNETPLLRAGQAKAIDYSFYSTTIFSYDLVRNADGEVQTDKKGRTVVKDFKMLKVAKAGQNKE